MKRARWLFLGWLLLAAGLLPGCDFTPDFHELDRQDDAEQPGASTCGGEGILCDVSGIAAEAGNSGNGGPALEAHHDMPVDVAMAPYTTAQTGEVYVVDWNNHCVRKITPDGIITLTIGTGEEGDVPTGPAGEINLDHPSGLTIGYDGNLYLSDWLNEKVLVVDAQTRTTSIVAGTVRGFDGDGGPASRARLDLPSSLIFDPNGILYLSDQGNHRIRKIDKQGVITTFAGSGKGYADGVKEEARFNFSDDSDAIPGGKLSMNTHDWALYIADTENNRIRRINFFTNEVTTIAGTGEAGYAGDGGSARMAQLNRPTDVIFAEDHRIYIADSGNNVIRKIDAFGTITTVVGTGEAGFSPDGTPAASAMLNRPMGIFYDETNRVLYIADTNNHQVKRVYDPY